MTWKSFGAFENSFWKICRFWSISKFRKVSIYSRKCYIFKTHFIRLEVLDWSLVRFKKFYVLVCQKRAQKLSHFFVWHLFSENLCLIFLSMQHLCLSYERRIECLNGLVSVKGALTLLKVIYKILEYSYTHSLITRLLFIVMHLVKPLGLCWPRCITICESQ